MKKAVRVQYSSITDKVHSKLHRLTLSQTTNLDSSKLKEYADDNFKFDENGRKLSKRVENTVAKGEMLVTSNFSFFHSVFKRLVSQERQKVLLCGNGLTHYHTMPHFDALKIREPWKKCEKRRNCL